MEVYGDDYPMPDGTCVRDYIHVIDLGWKSEFQDLRVIVESAWRWMQKHPNRYSQ